MFTIFHSNLRNEVLNFSFASTMGNSILIDSIGDVWWFKSWNHSTTFSSRQFV